MSRTVVNIRLFEGNWKLTPDAECVETVLRCRWYFAEGDSIDFLPPDDPDACLHVQIVQDTDDGELMRDELVCSLLRVFDPEYETMIEAEIFDD